MADADKMLKTVDFELVVDIWNDEEENLKMAESWQKKRNETDRQ